MPKTYESDCGRLVFAGDLHGAFGALNQFALTKRNEGTALVVCGDIGLGFARVRDNLNSLRAVNESCLRHGCELFLVRGNHDDPSLSDGETLELERVHPVPDYSMVKACGHGILCVGGAVSVDRSVRIREDDFNDTMAELFGSGERTRTYWENEIPRYDADALTEILKSGIRIDTAASHTAPSSCEPAGQEGISAWLKADGRLSGDLTEERTTMDRILRRLEEDGHPLRNWFYGHFHRHREEERDGVKFTLLDMMRNGRLDTKELQQNI